MKTEKKPRDARLDALRGLMLVLMAGVHVPTPLSHWFQEPFGFVSNAEGFIFLSACLAGLVYGRTFWRDGWQAMSGRVWMRTGRIYLSHLAVLLPIVLLAWALAAHVKPLANHFHDFLLHPWGALALIPLLLHQPPLFDILPLYVILLGLTPWLFIVARRHGWGVILFASGLIWLATQFHLSDRIIGDPYRFIPLRWGSFNLFAWQLVWTSGLALGETASRKPLLAGNSRRVVGIVSGTIVLAGLLARHGFITLNSDWFMWMDKWTIGPLRLLNFAAWVGFLIAWNPLLPARPLSPLALLGRHSLAVFTFHLPLVVLASTLIQTIPLSEAMQTVVGLSVIAALFPWAAWLEGQPKPSRSPAPAGAKIVARQFRLRFWKREPAA
ncbi:MAG TPA: OpgC domain-containing protein [Verrucomicrobiae bacterium]|nr:OpgC domain-containing protein [Verrucomicrobiae bacterium]